MKWCTCIIPVDLLSVCTDLAVQFDPDVGGAYTFISGPRLALKSDANTHTHYAANLLVSPDTEALINQAQESLPGVIVDYNDMDSFLEVIDAHGLTEYVL